MAARGVKCSHLNPASSKYLKSNGNSSARVKENGDEEAFLAGQVIIHVDRGRGKKGSIVGFKTHEETTETDVRALGNKARWSANRGLR